MCAVKRLRIEASDSASERARLTEDLAEARERVRAEMHGRSFSCGLIF